MVEQRERADGRVPHQLGMLEDKCWCVLLQMASVESLLTVRQREREQLKQLPRRMCGLTPAPNHPEVLGKVRKSYFKYAHICLSRSLLGSLEQQTLC